MTELIPQNMIVSFIGAWIAMAAGLTLGILFATKLLKIAKPSYWLWLLTIFLIAIILGPITMGIAAVAGIYIIGLAAITAVIIIALAVAGIMFGFCKVPFLKSIGVVLITGFIFYGVMSLYSLI